MARAKKQTQTKTQANEQKPTKAVDNLTPPQPAKVESPPAITLMDIQTMMSIIDAASQRGGFMASELQTVGTLYEKLKLFLQWAKGKEMISDEESQED